MNKKVKGGMLLILPGLCSTSLSIIFLARYGYRSIMWEQTTATITQITESPDVCRKKISSKKFGKKRTDEYERYSCLRFTAHGSFSTPSEHITLKVASGSKETGSSTPPTYKVGETIPVIYDRSNPQNYEVAPNQSLLPCFGFLVIGAVFLAIGAIVLLT